MVTAAHIAVHGKINLACLAHIQNLDSVGIIIDPRIILALAERKYLCALFFSCIINPERPVCHKGTVFPRFILHRLQILRIRNPQLNPVARIGAALSRKNLVRAAVIIHHVDALCAQLHREALDHIVISSRLAILHLTYNIL